MKFPLSISFFATIVGAAVVSRLAPGGSAQMMGVLTGTYATLDEVNLLSREWDRRLL